MKILNVLLFSIVLTYSAYSQQSFSNPGMIAERIRQMVEKTDSDETSRNFKKLPDTIYYAELSGGAVNNSVKYLISYTNNKITSMEYNDLFNKNIIRFNYDDQGRRSTSEEFIVISGSEIRQGGTAYHYDETGKLILVKIINNGDVHADSLDIVKNGDKISSYKRLRWESSPSNQWKVIQEKFNLQYDGDKIIGYESKEPSFDGTEILHHKYENVKSFESQNVEFVPELTSYFNYDTANFHQNIFSPYNAADLRLQYAAQGDVYEYNEGSSTFNKFFSSRITQEGQESILEVLNPDNENEVYVVETYLFDNDKRLQEVRIDNIVNGFKSQNYYLYGDNGRLIQDAFIGNDGDTVAVNEFNYSYDDEGDLVSYDELLRYGDFVSSQTLYQFGYKSSAKTASTDFQQVSVFPNPAVDFINVNINEKLIKAWILDLKGNVINEPKSDGNRISVEAMPAGAYILKVDTKSGTKISRFSKI